MRNSFNARSNLQLKDRKYEIFRLDALTGKSQVNLLPFSLKVLLENLLRAEDGLTVKGEDIEALASWDVKAGVEREVAFTPGRVLLQDFTGVPAVVDLAVMRDAMKAMGGDPARINPLQPAELVIDHSVQVDEYGTGDSFEKNAEMEFSRNRERYAFLRWGQRAFKDFKVVPPDTGIVHQINLEYLARVVDTKKGNGVLAAFPDTLVGTDSHTTMINGLGVLGWGVGGIEAEAAMLGQPYSMLIPEVIGFKLRGALSEGATGTDLVLTIVQMLRKKGVVGKFVEYYGDGLSALPLADRATIANMSPEYGATCGIFPVDVVTIEYLKFTGRSPEQIALVESYTKEQGLFHSESISEPEYTDTLELDLSTVEPSMAGPKRPQDRVPLRESKPMFEKALKDLLEESAGSKNDSKSNGDRRGESKSPATVKVDIGGEEIELANGSVVITAITSCTNTSNPAAMLGAGLVAMKAVERGLRSKPWVKTSLAPGSKVVMEYLEKAGLISPLETLGFNLVGFGCTTCIGNSGPLPAAVSEAIREGDLSVVSVISGNRNFEGRVHSEVRMNYLASPPLVVIYALAGRMDINLASDPLGQGADGKLVYLKDIWPSQREVQEVILSSLQSDMYRNSYEDIYRGDLRWMGLPVPEGDLFAWDENSTYIRHPPYFDGMNSKPSPVTDIKGARALAVLGDSVTTDHISPAGAIRPTDPAGRYLTEKGVDPVEFNSYGSRRGNHEVMMRGAFANVRLRNQMAPGTEGGWTCHQTSGKQMTIYDASVRYQQEGVPLLVLAGKEYGSGSSRDWAAKGPMLLGIRAVITESFERIHRSNLVGMGILPLQFMPGDSVEKLGLTGEERFDFEGIGDGSAKEIEVTAIPREGRPIVFKAKVRIDTPQEVHYYQNGGILHYVLRQLLAAD